MDNLVTEEAIFSVSFSQIMKTLTKAEGTFMYSAAKYSVEVVFVEFIRLVLTIFSLSYHF